MGTISTPVTRQALKDFKSLNGNFTYDLEKIVNQLIDEICRLEDELRRTPNATQKSI